MRWKVNGGKVCFVSWAFCGLKIEFSERTRILQDTVKETSEWTNKLFNTATGWQSYPPPPINGKKHRLQLD